VFTVGINRAVSLLAEKKAKSKTFRGAEALKELGNAPGGAVVKLMRGRYGPYVSDGTTNATVPRDMEPLSVTLDQAVALIADRAAKGGGKKPKSVSKPKKSARSKSVDTAASMTPRAAVATKSAARKKGSVKSKGKKPVAAEGG
jgi:DNA topoisomerase-1